MATQTTTKEWRKVRIDECFDIQQGKQVSKSNRRGDNQHPFLRTANVFWDGLDLTVLDHMHFTPAEEKKFALQNGDLLLCEGGDVGRTAMWRGEFDRCYYQNHLHRLRKLNNEVDENFVHLYLKYAFVYARFYLGRANITTIPNLSKSRLSELEISLPPLLEQKSIAQALTIVQNAITVQEKLIAKLKELKRSMMQHLFTHGTKNEKTKMTEIGEMPESWEVVKLGDICVTSSGGTPSRTKKQYYTGDIPWIKSGEMNDSYIEDSGEKITSEAVKNSSAKIFEAGTLLVAMYGATAGKTAILSHGGTTNQAVCGIFKNKNVNLEFIRHILILQRDFLLDQRHGGAQPNLSQTSIRNFLMPLPAIGEQNKIAESLIAIEKKIKTSQDKLFTYKNFFKTLLHELMSGERRINF